VNGVPSADFMWNPFRPIAGDWVYLVSTSTDFEGPLAALSWDLDGDGRFGDGSARWVRQPFTRAGAYDIGLRVTDSDDDPNTVRTRIVVLGAESEPPDGTGTPGREPSGGSRERRAWRLRPMSPFPVVRIAGTVLPRGARIRILSVRAPRGSLLRMRCKGKGCPVGSVATTSTTRVVRFPQCERRLRAGVRLKLFVRQVNRIGKDTSFLIRAGAPAKRVDLCLFPGRAPRRCP
jgi:hypothetical protein